MHGVDLYSQVLKNLKHCVGTVFYGSMGTVFFSPVELISIPLGLCTFNHKRTNNLSPSQEFGNIWEKVFESGK